MISASLHPEIGARVMPAARAIRLRPHAARHLAAGGGLAARAAGILRRAPWLTACCVWDGLVIARRALGWHAPARAAD